MASDHEDEDDDLYGSTEPKPAQQSHTKQEEDASSGDEPMDEGADSGDDDDDDDDEDDDSESDLEIIIDKPPTAPRPATQQAPQESKAIKIEAPNQTTSTPSQAPPKSTSGSIVPQLSTVPGTAYPAQKTSDIDVNGNPIYPPQGKPLLQVDMDADLAEEQKIWRRPGEDQSDYFNYGFDEFTWETYRQRQLSMVNTIQQQKNDMVQMQQMMGGGPMPGMPPSMPGGPGGNAAPTGPAGGGGGGAGGMNEQQQMEMMFQQMVSQGMDPSQMDFGSFMQMAGGGMGPGPGFGGPGGGQQGGFQGGGNQGGGRGGRGGRGRGW